jgi:hypothetical protein
MKQSRFAYTKIDRRETMKKIISLIEREYEGTPITTAFTKRLLLDTADLIDRAIASVPLLKINDEIMSESEED